MGNESVQEVSANPLKVEISSDLAEESKKGSVNDVNANLNDQTDKILYEAPIDDYKNESISDSKINHESKYLLEKDKTEDKNDQLIDDDFEDETIMERIVALSEMFPQGFTDNISGLKNKTFDSAKWVFSTTKNLTWILFSTATLLFLPAMLEAERVSSEEMEKVKRQQILLGPSAAMSTGNNAPLPPNTL